MYSFYHWSVGTVDIGFIRVGMIKIHYLVDWYLIRQHDTNIETLQWTVQARLVQISHWGLHQTDTLETPKVSNMVQQVGWTHKSNQSDLQAEVPCRHQAALLIGQRDVTNIWFNCGMRA